MTARFTQTTQSLKEKLEAVSMVVAEVEHNGHPLSSDVIMAVQTLGPHYVQHAGTTRHHDGKLEEEYRSLLSSVASMTVKEQAGRSTEAFLRQRASEVMQTITQHLRAVGQEGYVMPEWGSSEMVDLETQASRVVQAVQTLVDLSPARCSECNGCDLRMICAQCVEYLQERAVQEGFHTQVQSGDALWLADASRDQVYYLRSTQQLLDRHVWVAHDYDNKELSVITNERLTHITSVQEWVMTATTEEMAELLGADEMEYDEMVSFAKRQGDRFEILPFTQWKSNEDVYDRFVLQYEADPTNPVCRKIYDVKIVSAGKKIFEVRTVTSKKAKRHNNNNTVVLQRHRHGEYADSSVADSVDSSLARDEYECAALADEQISRHDLVAALTQGFKELSVDTDEQSGDLADLITKGSQETLSQEQINTIRDAARQFRGDSASVAPRGPPQQVVVSAILRAVESSLREGGAGAEQSNGPATQQAGSADGGRGPQPSASTVTYAADGTHPHVADPSVPRTETQVQSAGSQPQDPLIGNAVPQPHPQYGSAPAANQSTSNAAPQPHPQYGGFPTANQSTSNAGHQPHLQYGGVLTANPSTNTHSTFYNGQISSKETEAALRLLESQVPKLSLAPCAIPLTADSPSFGDWAQWVDAVEEAMRTAPGIAIGPLVRFVHGLTVGTVVAPLVKDAMKGVATADGVAYALWRAVVASSVPWERRSVMLRKAEWTSMARSMGHDTAVENLYEALFEDLQRQAPMTDLQLRAMLLGLTRELGFSDQEVNIAGVLPVVSGIYETFAGATAGAQFWLAVHPPLWKAVQKAAAAYREFLRVLGTDVDVNGGRWAAYVSQVRQHGDAATKASMESKLASLRSRKDPAKPSMAPSRNLMLGGQSRASRLSRGTANVAQDMQHEVAEVDGGRATYQWHGQTFELPLMADYRNNKELHREEYVRFWKQFKGMECGQQLDYDNTNGVDPTKMRRGDVRVDPKSEDCAFPWIWPVGTPHLESPFIMDGPDWLHNAQHLAGYCTAEHSPTYHSPLNVFSKEERRDINRLPYAERAQKISDLAGARHGLDHVTVVDLIDCCCAHEERC